jgi:translation initiation factor 3 subunit C
LVAFVDRLDDELTKSLQDIDPHTQDYIQRLQDETTLLELAEKAGTCSHGSELKFAENYYIRKDKLKHAARIAGRRVEHVYYKRDTEVKPVATVRCGCSIG